MTYNSITPEIQVELLKAQDAAQVMDILNRSGQECSAEEAEQIWQEIDHHKVDYKEEVSLDELEAVSGGEERTCGKRSCATTVGRNDSCLMGDVPF